MKNLVYFMTADSRSRVKIGCSRTPENLYHRYRQGMCWLGDIELLGVIPSDTNAAMLDLEKTLHSTFAEYHLFKEWFFLSPVISEYISTQAVSGASVLEFGCEAYLSKTRKRKSETERQRREDPEYMKRVLRQNRESKLRRTRDTKNQLKLFGE